MANNIENENVTEEVKAPKKPKATETDEVSALKEQVATLGKQVEMFMQMFAAMNTGTAPKNSLLDEIKLVHLVDRAPGLSTHIVLSNIIIDMTAFGEERTLDRRQAEELAGKYRKLFERGTIAFGRGCEEVSGRFSLKSVSEYGYMDSNFLDKLREMNAAELEELYNKLCDGHRDFVISYFKRKAIEKDPAFSDPYKIETLNRVSGGAMADMILDRQRENVLSSMSKK